MKNELIHFKGYNEVIITWRISIKNGCNYYKNKTVVIIVREAYMNGRMKQGKVIATVILYQMGAIAQ